MDHSNVREINYFKFIEDIDNPKDIFPQYVAKRPKEEKVLMHGELRDAGHTFFTDTTCKLDVINNRFLQKRVEVANNPCDVEDRL